MRDLLVADHRVNFDGDVRTVATIVALAILILVTGAALTWARDLERVSVPMAVLVALAPLVVAGLTSIAFFGIPFY